MKIEENRYGVNVSEKMESWVTLGTENNSKKRDGGDGGKRQKQGNVNVQRLK